MPFTVLAVPFSLARLTTAVGFLALVLSNSSGFIQLGVLIAIGISAAGLLMTTVFFLFVPRGNVPLRSDWILASVKKLCASHARPAAVHSRN